MSEWIDIKVYDEKTKRWVIVRTRAKRWEDKSCEIQYIRFYDCTVIYGNEYPIWLGEEK